MDICDNEVPNKSDPDQFDGLKASQESDENIRL
jgi:hypothetical protein